MKATQIKSQIENGVLNDRLTALYGRERADAQKVRYAEAIGEFIDLYGDREITSEE